MIVANLEGVTPDADGDLILGKITLRRLDQGDAHIAVDDRWNHVGSWDPPDADGDGIGDACDTGETAIPTLSEWGVIIFITTILGRGVVTVVRRRMV